MEAGAVGVPIPNVQQVVDMEIWVGSESATILSLKMEVKNVLVKVKKLGSA